MRRIKYPDHLKKARDVAIRAGWQISLMGNGHLKWIAPNGQFAFTVMSSGYPRSNKNDIAALRRAGLKI